MFWAMKTDETAPVGSLKSRFQQLQVDYLGTDLKKHSKKVGKQRQTDVSMSSILYN